MYNDICLNLNQIFTKIYKDKSGVELRILKHIFTPEEAKIATYLTFSFEPIEIIYDRIKVTGVSIQNLEVFLRNMAKKGGINSKMDGDTRTYSNAILVNGMYEYQINNMTKKFYKNFLKYSLEGFNDELYGTPTTRKRTIPVEQSVIPDLNISNYENIRDLINEFNGQIAIVECICRKGTELLGGSCKQTTLRETCFPFGWHAEFFIENGWGRPIKKEEALKILKEAETDGLIIQASNTIKPYIICCCCSCCCGAISSFSKISEASNFITTNFHSKINRELCLGCSSCVERCLMNAIELINERAKINLNQCIGCGNCITICPQNAIKLEKKKKQNIPPENLDAYFKKVLREKQELGKK